MRVLDAEDDVDLRISTLPSMTTYISLPGSFSRKIVLPGPKALTCFRYASLFTLIVQSPERAYAAQSMAALAADSSTSSTTVTQRSRCSTNRRAACRRFLSFLMAEVMTWGSMPTFSIWNP